jgi:hypothetical protein
MDADTAAAIRRLDQKLDEEQKLMDSHPGLLINMGKGGGQDTPNIKGSAINFEVANIPHSTLLTDTAFSGRDIKEKLKFLDGFQGAMAARYNRLVDGQHEMLYRVSSQHDINSLKAVQGQTLDDADNVYRNHTFPGKLTPAEAIEKAKSSSTPQFPTIKTADLDTFRQNNPGGYYYDEDGNLRRVKPRK